MYRGDLLWRLPASSRTLGSLRMLVPTVTRALPLLLLFVTFVFISTEVWQVATGLDAYLSLRGLAAYSGCSIRWLRDRLVDASHPLPCYRVEGKVLVRRSEFDVWIARFRSQGRPEVDRLVGPALRELLGR